MPNYMNVLILDDDELSSSLIGEILNVAGYETESCDKCSTLETIVNLDKYDTFIVDLMMNGLSGLDVIAGLRKMKPHAIIIAVTGLDATEYYIKAIKAGADHFFNKPINAEKLIGKLQSIQVRIDMCGEDFCFTEVISKAFDKSQNPIFITDDEGNLFYANKYFLDMAGLSFDRVCRHNLYSLRFENALELSQLINQKSYGHLENRVIETRFLIDKSHEVWFNVIINPVQIDEESSRRYFLFQLFDVTRKKQMDQFILSNEDKFRSFISLSNDGMALINEEGLVIEWNNSMTDITGVSIDLVYGEQFWDILRNASIEFDNKFFGKNLESNLKMALKMGLSDGKRREEQCRIRHSDGHIVYIQYSFFTIKMEQGFRMGVVVRDNTATVLYQKKIAEQNRELSKAYKQMEKLSRIDPLTQISNRRDIEFRLEYEIKRVSRQSNPLSIAILDIDDFKKVNDTYGHDAGDYILKEIASMVEDAIREQDIFGRWGGEEFIFVLPDTPIEGGAVICEKLRKKIEQREFIFGDYNLRISVTIGVAVYKGINNISDAIKRADLALYNGKENGKNRVVTN